MTLQVIAGAVISIAGFLSAALGMIFLISSYGIASRLAAGGVLCAAGVAAIAAGVILFRRGMRFSPGGIRRELLRLARLNNGELSEEVVIGSLGKSDAVTLQLASLVREGIATERTSDGRRYFVFNDFLAKLMLKKCPYCGNDYPVRDDIERCPTCGGDLKLHRSVIAKGETKYSMDEEDDSSVS
jgi:hypothetical protein